MFSVRARRHQRTASSRGKKGRRVLLGFPCVAQQPAEMTGAGAGADGRFSG